MTHGRVQDAPARWRLHSLLSALTVERRHALVVVLAIAVHLAHQATFVHWYIEDAAICFAYARNIVDGEGLVAFPGGERVEGYSNPLWMLLLVLFQAVGVEGWISAKYMAAAFGSAALPLSWLLAREALPGERGVTPLIAPLLLAGSAHHAIWSASALENSLFSLLLVTGALLVLREDRAEGARFPWSAVAFVGLALTRPEGVMYAAIAGFWVLCFSIGRGRGLRPAIVWATTFWAPYLLFEAWRIWTFSWPLPNTYYAKLGHEMHPLLRYYGRGWDQLRHYAQVTWVGYALWLLPVALLGRGGWRGRVAAAVTVVIGLMLLVPGPFSLRHTWFWPELPEPRWWLVTRIVALGVVAVGLPLLTIGGTAGWRARALVWHLGLGAVFFSLYSDGDWMVGLRWMSLFAPALAVLLAVGVDELLHLLPRLTGQPRFGAVGWLVTVMAVALWFPPNVNFSRWYLDRRDDYPEMVLRRVRYTSGFAEHVFLEERVRNLDMDMGAHLWWAPDHRMIDMAGLVDVPMALHDYGHTDPRQRDFVQEYVFDEQRPHFAHVHLRWAEQSNFKSYPDWDDTFFKMRGYVDGAFFHEGVYARRQLIMAPQWAHEPAVVRFSGGVTLEGVRLVHREAGAGRAMFLEAGWSTDVAREPDDGFTVTGFLSDGRGVVASWDLPMGVAYRGHIQLPVHDWRPGEVHHARFTLPVPDDLPEGVYDLGFVVIGGDGEVRAADGEVPDGWALGGSTGEEAGEDVGEDGIVGQPAPDAHVAAGEVRWLGAIEVVPGAAVEQAAEEERQRALAQAADGRCEQAEETWRDARLRLPADKGWAEQGGPEVRTALSACWTASSEEATDLGAQVALLQRAHDRDHRHPAYVARSEAVAAQLYAMGKEARARSDWEAAYRHFSDVLRITPYNAWARRYAEEARDHRLGLHDGQPWGRSFGWW